MRILLVEDEEPLRLQLSERLKKEGYSVDAVADGREALFLGQEHPFDAGVFDLGLPELSGLEVIRQLRDSSRAFPILILTARGRWQEKVEGLDAGADDYLVKPFQVEELLARLNALIRRSAGLARPVLRCNPIELNTTNQRLLLNGEAVELTAYEYRLLEYLMLHGGQVVSKTELTEHLYDQDFDRDSNVIEVFVGRLRKKLDPGNTLRPIETLRGRGYRFTLQPDGT